MRNAIISLNVRELARPLQPIQARFASSCSVKFVNTPEDAFCLYLRLFRADAPDGYFDCPCNQDANGDWTCYVIGTCFTAAGDAKYEVHATDEYGNPTALGAGTIRIAPFTVGGDAPSQGTEISVATLPDETGALHQVRAVNIGTAKKPDWSWEVKAVDGK